MMERSFQQHRLAIPLPEALEPCPKASVRDERREQGLMSGSEKPRQHHRTVGVVPTTVEIVVLGPDRQVPAEAGLADVEQGVRSDLTLLPGGIVQPDGQ